MATTDPKTNPKTTTPPEPDTLAWYREHHDPRISQSELAKAVGVHLDTIKGIENNRTVPSVETALKIARELGVSVEAVRWPSSEAVKGNKLAPRNRYKPHPRQPKQQQSQQDE